MLDAVVGSLPEVRTPAMLILLSFQDAPEGVVFGRCHFETRRRWSRPQQAVGLRFGSPTAADPVQFTVDLVPFGKYFNLQGTKA